MDTPSTETKTSIDPVVVERTYRTNPVAVFAAWTDVDLLTRWWGCATDMLWNVHEWDVRVGGAIHVSLDFDGEPYHVHGAFTEIIEPRRLEYDWENDQHIVVSIEAVDNGTLMRVEHHGLPNAEMGSIVIAGWTASTTQILEVLE